MQSPLLRTGLVSAFLLLIAGAESLPVVAEEIVQTTVCEVTADPANFNHKLIELTGTASEDMEKFTLSDVKCHHDKNNYTGIWLENGGRKRSGAKYCCNQPLDRERTVSLVVEGVATAIIDDKAFRTFDARVYPRGNTRAKLIGRFFAGTRQDRPNGMYLWGGYGPARWIGPTAVRLLRCRMKWRE
jgi:hypothetical protein